MAKAMTEEDRQREMHMMDLYIGIVITIGLIYVLGYKYSLHDGSGGTLSQMMKALKEGQLLFSLNAGALKGMMMGLAVGAFIYFVIHVNTQRNMTYKMAESAGTGGFMTAKELKEYNAKYFVEDPKPITNYPIKREDWETQKDKYSQNMIMSDTFTRPINSRKLIGNNNTLIVGGAGTGKSRFMIKPNTLQMNASYVITDPSGEIIKSVGKVLSDNGYKIKIFNIEDMSHSNCYNPLDYIRDEAGVNMLIQCLIDNTTKGEGGAGDNQFFVDAEKLLYSACIFYLKDFCSDDSVKNFAGVMNLINSSQVDENNANAKSPLDKLFDKLPQNSLAWKYYKAFKQAAGKTLKSIIISCVTRLQPFMTPQVVNLTRVDELHLDRIGDEKTALFIITNQADQTYSFLGSILYSQLFETLYHKGNDQLAKTGSEQLKVPVRCLMDEFANIGTVPQFPSRLSTMRKYNISATIVLQDMAQIESMYKDDWKTLVGNCSSIVFLGSQEPNTLEYFSKMLGKMTIRTRSTGVSEGKSSSSSRNFTYTSREVMTPDELGRLPSNECIVFTQNMKPVRSKKYRYERHPYYPQTADANSENAFNYKELSIFDNSKSGTFRNITTAISQSRKYKEAEEKDAVKMAKDIKLGHTGAEALNNVELNDRDKERLYSECMVELSNQAFEHLDEDVLILKLDNIASKYLPNLIVSLSKTYRNKPIIIFTSSSKNDKFLIGLGMKHDGCDLLKAMDNPHKFQLKEKNEQFYFTFVNKTEFDDYQKYILSNIEFNDNSESTENASETEAEQGE